MSVHTPEDARKVTTRRLCEMKQRGEKISMLTSYDYTMAEIVDKAGIDVILVGDSASNVVAGNVTTLPITLDQMIYHGKSVVRGVKRALVVVDMPFGTYQTGEIEAVQNAIKMMKITHADALKLEGGVEILGGHTAVSRNVEAPVATVQMYGELSEAAGLDASSFLGMDVVMTKYCGLGGTALLAGHYREELEDRYQKRFIKRAVQLLSEIQKNGECQIALENGAVYAHAAAEGGVFGALWELAEYAQCGLKIDLRRIPILQETVEICEVFDLNPYQLRTEGVFLFLTEHGERLCEKLSEEGICAAVIGKTVAGLDRAVHNEEEVRYLEPNRVEEYERIRSLREASGVE